MTPSSHGRKTPKKPGKQFTLVETAEALQEACKRLAKADRLAVDTEFVREKYYYPRVEVVQVSDGDFIALIDVQTIKNLEPLSELLGDRNRLKIFHAADQDVEVINYHLGVVPEPLFDTQIAASLLGHGLQVSLGNLIKPLLKKDVPSKQTVTDWSQRPLSADQLSYAAADVEHLHVLHHHLVQSLKDRRRLTWYEGEMRDRLDAWLADDSIKEQELYRRVKDWMSLSRKELAILRELALWREETARSRNIPRRAVLTDEGLIDLARYQPDSKEKALKLRRLNGNQLHRSKDEIFDVIQRGLQVPKDQWPEKPTSDRQELPTGLLELCQALLRSESDRHDIAASVIATSSELSQVIFNRNQLDERHTPLLHGWRRELVGEKLLALLRGELVVTVGKDGNLVFAER